MHMGRGLFAAESCGQPGLVSETIHPPAVAALEHARIPVPASTPRSWAEFSRSGARRMDFVVTLDERAMSSGPGWPGQPITALWAFEDAAALEDANAASHAAMQILFALQRRLELLINLPFQHVDPGALRSDLRDLGRMA